MVDKVRQWEGVILVGVSPFLLFPTVFILGTAAALLVLALLWLALWAANRQPWPVSPLNGALLLWAVAVLVGIVVSAEPDLTLPKTTGLLLGLAALHIYGLGDALAPGSKPAVLLWVILGLIAAAGKK